MAIKPGTIGNYYEDWEIGHVYQTAPRAVTIEDVQQFAEVEGSKSAMHLDPGYAKETIWGRMSVHGLLVVSMAAGMMGESGLYEGTAMAAVDMTWQYKRGVFIGDTIVIRWWVSAKRPTSKPGRGLVTRDMEVVNQDGEVCSTGTMAALWKMRSSTAGATL